MEKFLPWCKWLAVLALLLAAPADTTMAAIAKGYLPWLGPSPLRFASVIPRSAEPLLPALQLTNPVSPPAKTPATPSVSSETLLDPSFNDQPDFLNLPPVPESDPSSPIPDHTYPATLPITPESLVLLLRATGTNVSSPTLVLPAFIPPSPPPPPASSATYHSAPAPP